VRVLFVNHSALSGLKNSKVVDFDVRNEERGKPPTKFEDNELQALLDEDDAQTQQQLVDQLNVIVTRSCLHTFEIYEKDPEEGKMDST